MEIFLLIIGLAFVAAAVIKPKEKSEKVTPVLGKEKLLDTGLPPDGIPSIDKPVFQGITGLEGWLGEKEPVIVLNYNEESKAYPVQILIWHEIVNDFIGGLPVALTYSGTTNSAVAMVRQVGNRVLDFGTSGRLYNGATVMYDRQTRSLWLHFTGFCVNGRLTGKRLKLLPVAMVSFKEFKLSYPKGKVLSRETGFKRNYGRTPYVAYGRSDERPFVYDGEIDDRLLPKERILGIYVGDLPTAFPYSLFKLQEPRAVVQTVVKDTPVVIFYSKGTNSALDTASIAFSKDVGATAVFSPQIDDRVLNFTGAEEGFKDKETESTWTLLGRCIKGELEGKWLKPMEHLDSFWFAWAAYYPETDIFTKP